MTAVQDFAAGITTHLDRVDASVADLQADVAGLKDDIAALDASPGAITASDQTLLDAISARIKLIADKLDALDALTPPKPPV